MLWNDACPYCGLEACDGGCGGKHSYEEEHYLYRCAGCDEGIALGEDVLDLGRERYCRSCVEVMSTDELVEFLGFSLEKARLG